MKKDRKTLRELKFQKIMSSTERGEIHTLLMTFQFKLKDIESMNIEWNRFENHPNKSRANKGNQIKVPFIEINYMSHLNERFVNKIVIF